MDVMLAKLWPGGVGGMGGGGREKQQKSGGLEWEEEWSIKWGEKGGK